MAVLQNIREKCGVLVIVIVGLALLAFLLGDFIRTDHSHGRDTVIAKINGSKVEYTEWQNNYYNHRKFYELVQGKVNPADEKGLKEEAWRDILNTYVWDEYYKEVGLGISEEELEDLLFGPKHAHYVIAQYFRLQKNENDEYNTENVRKYFDYADEDQSVNVVTTYLRDYIKNVQIKSKYDNMLSKGFYTPTALAKMYYEDQANSVDFVYAYRDYGTIKDEDITVSDNDLQTYYEKHKNRFVVDQENRDLEYVVFNITPSESDINEIKKETEELRTEMMDQKDNFLTFAQLNSSNSRPESRRMYKDDIYMNLKDAEAIGFNEDFFNSEVGTTSEILMQDNYFLFGRILEVADRPDTVNASHILIRPTDTVTTLDMCKATADSIAEVLRKANADSAAFAAMAIEYSQDPGSKEDGGNLGDFTEGTMIPEFNEACFTNEAGTIQVVESDYGIHVIKINSQTKPVRKVKLAVLDQEIKFSDNTYETVFQTSNSFYAKSLTAAEFDKNAADQKLDVRSTKVIDMSDDVFPGIENSREIVQWAFNENRKEGEDSIFESSARDKFLVVKLSKIHEKGFAPLEDVKDEIEPEVRKQLKAEKMMAEMKGMTVEAVAQKFDARTDTLTNINFASFSLPGLGFIEPKINAIATTSEVNKVSDPIDGNYGVYVIKVLKKNAAPEKQDFENDKLAKMQEYMRSTYRMENAVKKLTKIEDRRVKFF